MKIYDETELARAIPGAKIKQGSAIAAIFAEDGALVRETVRFHLNRGFAHIFLFITCAENCVNNALVTNICSRPERLNDVWGSINEMIPLVEGCWLYWGYNAEFFFYPFSATRTVSDLADFLAGEKRANISAIELDLYPGDCANNPEGYTTQDVYFDSHNYYSQPMDFGDADIDKAEHERIFDIRGGLHWRFAEWVGKSNQSLSRVPFFFVTSDLVFDQNGMTARKEFHTMQSEHHRSVTSVVASFRAARILRHNPQSRDRIVDFKWEGSRRFRWSSEQLLRQGFMETGQWF